MLSLCLSSFVRDGYAAETVVEPVQACIIERGMPLTPALRQHIAQCLDWHPQAYYGLCQGSYFERPIAPILNSHEVHIAADKVSIYNEGRSELSGNVEVQEGARIVNANTAYIYRDPHSNQVTRVELLGAVHYVETGRLMIAKKATLFPQNKAGSIQDVIYRFHFPYAAALLPAWGIAAAVERLPNQDYVLQRATYSTCAPTDDAWRIEAKKIYIDQRHAVGTAQDAKLLIKEKPILYIPYFTFPTSKERKSGFLIPTLGSTNIGGLDFSIPYYFNLSPQYDAVIAPHIYTRRGVMLGGQFRYLTPQSTGEVDASFLSHDRAYTDFLKNNQQQYPQLLGAPTDRWYVQLHNLSQLTSDLAFRLNFQQVSDDYYLQDFTSNLALLTERQLVREAELTYTLDHWILHGLAQSYQTLQPINESLLSDIYQRLPQVKAQGNYENLWFNGHLSILGQLDSFDWPNRITVNPEGQRYYINPILTFPQIKPWGYITPSVEIAQNYYDLNNYNSTNSSNPYNFLSNNYDYLPISYPYNDIGHTTFYHTIPRYSLDMGLSFEKETRVFQQAYTQTLEPRIYYLYVPYDYQSMVPVFDSGYMIFNSDQLFRTNRFSGFDRIGDANQIAYAITSRWVSEVNGAEKANFTIGQIRYFTPRKVQLCQNTQGSVCEDSPLTLGYLAPQTEFSPIASRLFFHFTPAWNASADYVWDVNTTSTYNANAILSYQPAPNQMVNVGYTYFVNGDITVLNAQSQVDPLHQISTSFAWPLNEKWSALGAYNYNISKKYEMLSFLGIQYDTCCWAIRLIGGRSFQSLSSSLHPQYNNNVYLQVQLKGLGSMGTSDPAATLRTYLPTYVDSFHHS